MAQTIAITGGYVVPIEGDPVDGGTVKVAGLVREELLLEVEAVASLGTETSSR